MRLGLTARMLLASGLLAAAVAGAFTVVVLEIRDQHKASRLVQRAFEVSAAANELERLAIDLQTSTRGFVITGEDGFLDPWRQARSRIPDQVIELDSLILDPEQKADALRIARLIQSYDDDYATPLVATARSDRDAAFATVARGEGKRRMDAIRAEFERFEQAQHRLVAERDARARSELRWAITAGLAGLVACVLLIFLFAGYLTRAVVVPVRRVADAALRLAGGNLAVRVAQKGAAEIGDLTRDFNAMASSLQENRDELESQNAELEIQTVELEDRQAQLESANDELEAQRTELEQAHGELAHEKERIDSFYRFGEMIAAEKGSEPLGPQILRQVADLLEADVGALYAFSGDGEDLYLSATRGLDRGALADPIVPGEGLPGRAIVERRPVAASHPESGLRLPAFGDEVVVRHEVHVPLLQGEDVVGLLTLGRVADRPFSPGEVEAVEHLARQSAIRISNVVAYERAEKLADINRTVLDATKEAIVLVDLEGEIVLANAAAERMGELHGVEAVGNARELAAAIRDRTTDPEAYWAAVQAGLSDPDHVSVTEYEMAESGHAFQRYTAPVRNSSGTPIGRVVTLREITSEREVDRLKSEIVATVSHELRTPLASIVGFSELLLTRDLDSEKRGRYAQTIYKEASRLTVLINDFLDLQKIESGNFTLALEPFDLGDVLTQQVGLFAGQSLAHSLGVESPDEPIVVLGERDRIEQVLGNLLSNAIKYSPAGGPVRVTAELRDDVVRVSVRDCGLGIPAAQQAQIFTKFFRVDSSDTRKIGGTGLGLALCREIVEAHGGHIGFESSEGEGSTFWFELPVGPRVHDQRSRALIVEDDPAAALLLAEHLKDLGFASSTVATGEAALELAFEQTPDLVCLDIMLAGEVDGWEVLARLRENAATANVPVVICTGRNGRERAAALGATDLLTKPFSAARLREAVMRALPAGGRSVLIVDDEEDVRRLVAETLTGDGLDLREAADGAEALEAVALRRPDAIVLDLIMPEVDGFVVLERLQADENTRSIPVVVLTGRNLSPAERARLRTGAVSLLEKSAYSSQELRALILQAVGRGTGGSRVGV